METLIALVSGALGSLLTIIIQSLVKMHSDKKNFARDLNKVVFVRKIEVAEKAMSWLQEISDAYVILKMSLENLKNHRVSTSTFSVMQNAITRINNSLALTQSQLNPIFLYYDFKDIEKKYNMSEVLDSFKEVIDDFNNAEFTNNNDLKQNVIMSIDELLNRVVRLQSAVAEIQKKLNSEFKAYDLPERS